MLKASHSQMKRAALSARVDEEHAAVPLGLVGDDADGAPVDAREAGEDLAREELLDLAPRALVDDRVDDGVHVEGLVLVGRDDLLDALARPDLRRTRCGRGRRMLEVLRAGRRGSACRRRWPRPRSCTSTSPQPLTGAVHLGAAHLLERDLLADDHLGHARRAEVHAGVALDHHDDVAERRDVGAAGRGGSEEQAHLRHQAAHAAPGCRRCVPRRAGRGTSRSDR